MSRLLVLLFLAASPARAGDPVVGQALFENCTACHALTQTDGVVLVPGGTTGPDLFGVAGRAAGGFAGYAYSKGLKALGAAGHVWDRTSLAAFIANPNTFLEETLGPGHRSKMPFGAPKGAADIAAYLATLR